MQVLDEKVVQQQKPDDTLATKYVALSTVELWEKNPKLHNIGALAKSILSYGFRDPPIYDATADCLVAGNGRIETLRFIKNNKMGMPRGIVEHEGEWYVPVTFGIDAKSKSAAEAFAVDHNNMVMSGGNFDLFDMANMWDREGYKKVVTEIASSGVDMVTLDGDDVDALVKAFMNDENEKKTKQDKMGGVPRTVKCPDCGHMFEI